MTTEVGERGTVLLATSGGPGLRASLAGVPSRWSDVVVFDPVGIAPDVAGARVVRSDPLAVGHWGRVLALLEGEVPTPELSLALDALAHEPGPDVGRVRRIHRGAGWELQPRGAVCRLGLARGAALRMGRSTLELRQDGAGMAPVLPGALVRDHGTVEQALAMIDADAAALAALASADCVPGLGGAAWAMAITTGALLLGRAPRRVGWGRWIGAALLGYGSLLSRVKLLERRGLRQ